MAGEYGSPDNPKRIPSFLGPDGNLLCWGELDDSCFLLLEVPEGDGLGGYGRGFAAEMEGGCWYWRSATERGYAKSRDEAMSAVEASCKRAWSA